MSDVTTPRDLTAPARVNVAIAVTCSALVVVVCASLLQNLAGEALGLAAGTIPWVPSYLSVNLQPLQSSVEVLSRGFLLLSQSLIALATGGMAFALQRSRKGLLFTGICSAAVTSFLVATQWNPGWRDLADQTGVQLVFALAVAQTLALVSSIRRSSLGS